MEPATVAPRIGRSDVVGFALGRCRGALAQLVGLAGVRAIGVEEFFADCLLHDPFLGGKRIGDSGTFCAKLAL